MLNGVEVTATRPIYSMEDEKIMYNVSEDPSIQTGTTSDALQNTPGVEVDVEGTFRLKLKTLNEDALPVVMAMGLAYQFTEDFVGQFEVEKDSQRSGIRLSGGLEYLMFERFSLRAGVQHNPNILSFGVGYLVRNIHVDVAAQLHQVL